MSVAQIASPPTSKRPPPSPLPAYAPPSAPSKYEDANYIIGSVAVPDYPESEDVHVYIHRDGWFLAYYLAADPAGKIIDWRLYHNTGRDTLTTKLESALSMVALPVGVMPSGISSYDFRNPNANRLIMIADWTLDTDTFQVNLPNDFGYFERSWSFGTSEYTARLKLNGQLLVEAGGSGWQTRQGTLTALQLPPTQSHVFEVVDFSAGGAAYGGVVLIYRVP